MRSLSLMIVRPIPLKTSDRVQSGTLYIPNEAGGSGILFAHGYNSNSFGYRALAVASAIATGATCLTIDLGGHGQSEGNRATMSISEHLDEMQTAFDQLADEGTVDEKRIGVVGASYGGYLALRLAEVRSVKSLVMRAPALYPDGMDDLPRQDFDTAAINEFRNNLFPAPENHALETMQDFSGTVEIVRSQNDESIPVDVIRAYVRAGKQAEEIVISGAEHSLKPGMEREAFSQIIVNWARAL